MLVALISGKSMNLPVSVLMAQILKDADFSSAIAEAQTSASAADATYQKAAALSAKIAAIYDGWQAQVGAQGVYVDEGGIVRSIPKISGVLPADVTLNGGVYVAGATALPPGLSSNGGVIMTDGSVYFPGTFSNGGVLCANPNGA
ncbi:hypothetical protein Gbfr_040_004 [Gluconobacter frateurii M-2]|nr:hypothetical protein Gbfr_040_004 [Gluconobacter frateurii M-2]